jgi:uncharacterized membrane protein (DUF485 family)
MIALCNVIIIPFLVDIIAASQFKETKSQMQSKILRLNLIFMSLNMIFLPLTGLVQIEEFLNIFVNIDISVIDTISKNIGEMAAFFTSYVMQVTFISNCI